MVIKYRDFGIRSRIPVFIIQKNHLSVTIELFRHYCKKGKVILWQKRITI